MRHFRFFFSFMCAHFFLTEGNSLRYKLTEKNRCEHVYMRFNDQPSGLQDSIMASQNVLSNVSY